MHYKDFEMWGNIMPPIESLQSRCKDCFKVRALLAPQGAEEEEPSGSSSSSSSSSGSVPPVRKKRKEAENQAAV